MAIIFSDVSFTTSSVGNGDLLFNVDCVRSSIFTIIGTNIGERLFHPDFGSNIERLLFDPMDNITTDDLRYSIFECLIKWEPRIKLDKKQCSIVPDLENQRYFVTLTYFIPQLEATDNLTFNLSKGSQ